VHVSAVGTVDESTYDGSCSSFTEFLLDHLQRNDASPITVEGYVISKRSLGKQLVFCDFQTTQGDLCQTLLRLDYYTGDHFAGYKRCLLKGTKFQVTGIAAPTRNPGNVVLLIQSMELLSFPRQIQHIQIILNQGLEGAVPMEQVVRASHRTELQLVTTSPNIKEKQWLKELAKDIFRSLPDDPHYPRAADQKEISRQGNYFMPEAPNEWQRAPQALLLETDNISVAGAIQESLSVEQALQQQRQDDKDVTLISVRGWVQNRRRFDHNVTMIALVDDLVLLSEDKREVQMIDTDRLSCLVHPDLLLDDRAGLYSNLLGVGAQVWIQGNLIPDTFLGRSLVWVNDIRLVQSSSQSVTIRHLLDLLHEGDVELDEVADALLLPYQDAKQELLKLDATERQWKANELAARLQEASSSMRRVIDPKLLEVMEKYQHLAQSHPVIPTNMNVDTVVQSSSSQTKYSKAMPIGMPGSKWESKKRPQLEWMGQQIRKVLESHPDYGTRKLSILDIGGGKGSLATYLGQAIHDVQIHVVDICEGAVANGRSKADRLQLPVEFQIADASSSDVDHIEADVVVALHACGHLSDVALAQAVHRRAGFVIVPCCFNSNPNLRIPKSGRSVPDWLDLPPDDWSALKLLAEVQGDIPLASEAIAMVCAVRAEAVTKHLMQDREPVPNISIRSFPIQYSTRNTVLIGMCSNL
jgi:2-polyprenyl-3-methyl-5-hydroxy-6-metoxy-1,4-benzoquinol methylase